MSSQNLLYTICHFSQDYLNFPHPDQYGQDSLICCKVRDIFSYYSIYIRVHHIPVFLNKKNRHSSYGSQEQKMDPSIFVLFFLPRPRVALGVRKYIFKQSLKNSTELEFKYYFLKLPRYGALYLCNSKKIKIQKF